MSPEAASPAPADDGFREHPTMTFHLSEVSTVYEPAYESADYEPQTSLTPLAKRGAVASLSLSPSSYQQHKRQQSAPVFSLPRLNNSRSPSLSPTRRPPHHTRQHSQEMPLTGDGRGGRPPPQNAPGRFANWFNASTPPVVDERGSPNTTPKSSRGGGGPITPNETTTTTPKSATQARFGFFTSVSTAFGGTRPANQTTSLSPQQLDDELCDLDIEAALYPSAAAAASSPTSTLSPTNHHHNGGSDTFSPAAYKNLQTNAAGLLLKMQSAYRERVAALREAQAEREAQREELEETRLRVALFRTQLEDMARKAAEHEGAMQRLVAELEAEKRARHEERAMMMAAAAAATREKATMMAVPADGSRPGSDSGSLSVSTPSEDLGVDDAEDEEQRRRRWQRSSRGTVKSDLSVETMTTDGGDSISASTSTSASAPESVFSRSRSPTIMTSITTVGGDAESNSGGGESRAPSVILPAPQHQKAAAIAGLAPPKPKPAQQQQQQQQLSAFQKFVKGISGSENQTEKNNNNNNGPESCRNCRGQESSVAWDTVSLLRDENRGLKQRVSQLEVAVEGALDAVNGIGL